MGPNNAKPDPIGKTPVPESAGNLPRVYRPKSPTIPGATVSERHNPVQVEPPSRGLLPDEEIPTEPGRPRPGLPEPPETPLTERPRSPRTHSQRYK